jgi:hypothetical protein
MAGIPRFTSLVRGAIMLSHEKACAVPLLTVRELWARRTDETREDPIFYFTMLMYALGERLPMPSLTRAAPRDVVPGGRTSGRCTLICVTSPKSPGAAPRGLSPGRPHRT